MGLPILKPAFFESALTLFAFSWVCLSRICQLLKDFFLQFHLINDEKGGCYFWTMKYSILVCYNNSKKYSTSVKSVSNIGVLIEAEKSSQKLF